MALSRMNSLYIQNLLKLHPAECNIDRTVIFTIAPRLWNKELLDENTILINLSQLTGLRSLWSVSRIEDQQIKTFMSAGWPLSSIYPASLKGFSQSFLLKNPEGKIILLFKINLWSWEYESDTDFANIVLADAVAYDIPWGCTKEGEEYVLLNTATGERSIFDRFPSPGDIGVTIAKSGTNPNLGVPDIRRPQTPASLFALLTAIEADQIIFDHSLTCELKIGNNEKLASFANELNSMLGNKAQFLYKITSNEILHAIFGLFSLVRELDVLSSWVLFLPAHLLVHPKAASVRNYLVNFRNPFAVLEYPNIPGESLDSPYSILYLGGNRDHTYFRELDVVEKDIFVTQSHPWFKGELIWKEHKDTDCGYTAKLSPDTPWTYMANSPAIKQKIENLSRLGKVMHLGELCQINKGVSKESVTFAPNGTVTYIRVIDLIEGSVNFEHAQKISHESNITSNIVNQNDLLLRRKISVDDVAILYHNHSFSSRKVSADHAATIYKDEQLAVVSDDFIIIRPISDQISSPYLREYLNSDTARKLLKALATEDCGHVASKNEMYAPMLATFPVPTVETKMLQGWENIDHLGDKLVQEAADLRTRLQSLFASEDGNTFRSSLGELQRRSNLINTSVGMVDRLEFQIANFYPFPIAYGYRLLASKVNPTDLYREQLRVAENILAFLASISLSILKHFEKKDLDIDLSKYWQSGISPGDWKDIIRRSAKVYSNKDHLLIRSLLALKIEVYQKGFGADINRLIQAKNDFKHDRGPDSTDDIRAAAKELLETLNSVMRQLAFFTDFPIRLIQDYDRSRSGELTHKCLVFIGDHPGLYQEEILFPLSLKKDDLYLDMGNQEWIPLYPFTAAMNCPSCKVRETYFIDKFDKDKDSVQFKSYERGHITNKEENISSFLK